VTGAATLGSNSFQGTQTINGAADRLSFPIVRLPDGVSREEGEARISAAPCGSAARRRTGYG
jgi:hypothetical protein